MEMEIDAGTVVSFTFGSARHTFRCADLVAVSAFDTSGWRSNRAARVECYCVVIKLRGCEPIILDDVDKEWARQHLAPKLQAALGGRRVPTVIVPEGA